MPTANFVLAGIFVPVAFFASRNFSASRIFVPAAIFLLAFVCAILYKLPGHLFNTQRHRMTI